MSRSGRGAWLNGSEGETPAFRGGRVMIPAVERNCCSGSATTSTRWFGIEALTSFGRFLTLLWICLCAASCEPVLAQAPPDKSGVKPGVISLPTGAGSIEGLGESFEPQLNTGSSTYGVNISVPAGRAGLQPAIRLGHDLQHGEWLGWTWLGTLRSVPSSDRPTRVSRSMAQPTPSCIKGKNWCRWTMREGTGGAKMTAAFSGCGRWMPTRMVPLIPGR